MKDKDMYKFIVLLILLFISITLNFIQEGEIEELRALIANNHLFD